MMLCNNDAGSVTTMMMIGPSKPDKNKTSPPPLQKKMITRVFNNLVSFSGSAMLHEGEKLAYLKNFHKEADGVSVGGRNSNIPYDFNIFLMTFIFFS